MPDEESPSTPPESQTPAQEQTTLAPLGEKIMTEKQRVDVRASKMLTKMPKDLVMAFTTTVGKFLAMLDPINLLTDVAVIRVKKDDNGPHMSIKAVDPSHIMMSAVRVPKNYFESSLQATVGTELGIPLEQVYNYLNQQFLFPKGKAIEVGFTDTEMIIRYRLEQCTLTKRFQLIDAIAISEPKVPNLDLPAIMRDAPVKELASLLRANFNIAGARRSEKSDHLRFVAVPTSDTVADAYIVDGEYEVEDKLAKQTYKVHSTHIALETNFIATARTDEPERKKDETDDDYNLRLTNWKNKGAWIQGTPIASLFPVDYLHKALKCASKHTKGVEIHIGTDYPIRVSWEYNGIEAHFLLAPRIESE